MLDYQATCTWRLASHNDSGIQYAIGYVVIRDRRLLQRNDVIIWVS